MTTTAVSTVSRYPVLCKIEETGMFIGYLKNHSGAGYSPPSLGMLLWIRIGHVLGWINTRIILGVVFRLFGHDPMRRKLERAATTYRQPSHHLPRERMERPF